MQRRKVMAVPSMAGDSGENERIRVGKVRITAV